MNEPTFSFNKDSLNGISKKIIDAMEKERKTFENKIVNVTDVLWRTARAKRPMITAKQAKAQGRSKRVSDPGASYGVPVDTGALQISIEKSYSDSGKKMVGKVSVNPNVSNPKSGQNVGKYAVAVEYGTSKMPARSYMRSSLLQNKEFIRKTLRQKQS
jgi:HK97 gp10 family phage protein